MTRRLTLWIAALAALVLVAPDALARQDAPPAQGAEAAAPEVPEDLESPRATMMSFLDAMSAAPPDMTVATQTLAMPPGADASAGEQAAARLIGVLNRIGEVQAWHLPDRASVQRQDLDRFVFFPQRSLADHRDLLSAGAQGQIVLARQADGSWKFSRATVEGLDALYASVESVERKLGADEAAFDPTLRLRRMMPEELRGRFLDIAYYQWLGLLLLIFVTVVLDWIVQAVLRTATATRIRKRGGEVEADSVRKAMRPYGLFAAALFLVATVWILGLPVTAQRVVLVAVRLVLSVAGVWAAFRTADLIGEIFERKAAGTESRYDDLLIPLIRKTAKIFIFAIGVIYIANSLSIEIVPLLTGLGIGGLAVAFAAKDTIENFFGSVAVVLDQPFQVGDWIKVGDTEGTVEELGFRSTRVRTFYNSLVTVPNATLVRATVDNYGKRKYRRTSTSLSLTYDTAPERIEAFCEGVREIIRTHPYTRKDYYCVYFNNFGAHSLDVMLYCFHECPDWQTELRERQRLFLDILRLADRLGVEFAYPTQTLFVNPEHASAEPSPPPGSEFDDAARNLGRREAAAIMARQAWRTRKPAPEQLATSAQATGDDASQVESKIGGDG
jgi:MscS family membrane protein